MITATSRDDLGTAAILPPRGLGRRSRDAGTRRNPG